MIKLHCLIMQGDILIIIEQEVVCKGQTRYIKLWLKNEFLMTLMKLRSVFLEIVAI